MNLFIQSKLSGIRDVLLERLRSREIRRDQFAGIRDAVEQVVDGADARIRLVSGYQKKLHAAVYGAIDYADNLVEQIPAAIELTHRSFASNEYLGAFFVDFPDLKNVFSSSSELREFLQDCQDTVDLQCCALLCMHKTEKTVMGMELSGDVLTKEVSQVAVSFSDHMLHSPAPSETETREGLKQCLFAGLTTNALERIMKSRLDSGHLQDMRKMLSSRLLHLQHKLHSNGSLDVDVMRDIEASRLELSDIDKALMQVPRATPQQSLEHVQEVFSQPDQFVRLSRSSLVISRMGIRIDQDEAQSCHRLELAEVTIGSDAPRVVTLVKFPTEELLA